ncbi:MAG: NADP-dependent oxidoreductase [Steroidobacteraceae bacterium]
MSLRTAALLVSLVTAAAAVAAPKTSQAIVQGNQGLVLQSVTTPVPSAGQVLLRIYAAGVNPVDWKRRAPVPGFDAAGIVDSVGPDVTAFKPGDAVVARVNGAYAEYAVALADEVIPKPSRFTFEQAAGIPVAGVAGYRAATDAQLQPGQRVAIIGAAGGSGEVAVQVAKSHGARIIAVGHSSQQDFLRRLGAAEFVAYDRDDVAARVQQVDAVINLVEGQADAALGYVRRGGRFTSIAGAPADGRCAAAGVTCVVVGGGYRGPGNGESLRALAALAERGQYNVTVYRTFPLAEAAQAQALGSSGQSIGKIILVVVPQNSRRQ